MKLSELKDGQRGKIRAIHIREEDSMRLFYLGIYPNARLQKIQCAPLKDPILFMVKGTQLVLRKQECECIEVEVEE